jgi:DNA-binding SARP family transcriptional activator
LSEPGLRYFLLGRLRVTRGDRECTPTADKQRVILALLLINANEHVSTEYLIGELWGAAPPKSARAALHGYLTALRRVLGDHRGRGGATLRTVPGGYVLTADPCQVDAQRSRDMLVAGRAALADGRPAAARVAFTEARALWRGAPLSDVPPTTGMLRHLARLDEEHLCVVLAWAEAMLHHGAGQDIIGDLEDLSTRFPLRESVYGLLMLALEQTGRRADALVVYARAYRALTGEAGIEPGAGLRAVHRALLDGPTGVPVSYLGAAAT